MHFFKDNVFPLFCKQVFGRVHILDTLQCQSNKCFCDISELSANFREQPSEPISVLMRARATSYVSQCIRPI